MESTEITEQNTETAQTPPWRALDIIGLCLLAGLTAFLIVTRPESGRQSTAPAATSPSSLSVQANEDPASLQTAARRPASFYTRDIRGGLFSAPQPPALKLHRVKIVSTKPPRVEASSASFEPVEPVNPFGDWSYTGTVKMGNQIIALLENTKTREGEYVTVGQPFLGAQVNSVTDQRVTLRSEGRSYRLPKSEKITVVQLDRSAAYLSAPTPPPPPQTPAPQAVPQPPGQMPGQYPPALIDPNGQRMRGAFGIGGMGRRQGLFGGQGPYGGQGMDAGQGVDQTQTTSPYSP